MADIFEYLGKIESDRSDIRADYFDKKIEKHNAKMEKKYPEIFGKKIIEDALNGNMTYRSNLVYVASPIVFEKLEDGSVIAKKSGKSIAIYNYDNEPGYRDLLTDDFWQYEQVIDINNIDLKSIKFNELYLCDKKCLNRVGDKVADHVSIEKIQKFVDLSKKEDSIIDFNKLDVVNGYYIANLYRNGKILNKKVIGKITGRRKTEPLICCLESTYYYLVDINTKIEYLVVDRINQSYGDYHDIAVKNIVPLEIYLNKPQVTMADIKALLSNKTYITSDDIKYTDIVLKTINDYREWYSKEEQLELLKIANNYCADLEKIYIEGGDDKLKKAMALQKKYLNTLYNSAYTKSWVNWDISDQYQAIKKALKNNQSK